MLSILVEHLHALKGHIGIELGDDLHRRMHGQHRHTGVDGLNVAVCHIARHSSAAALVDLSCQITSFSANSLRIYAMTSADASEEPDFPRAPVYLKMPVPWLIRVLLRRSHVSA